MKTITQRFNHFYNPGIGAIITLSKAIRGMHYGKQIIVGAFNKFIPKDEYAKEEKDEIIEWLWSQNYLNESPEKPLQNKDLKNDN